MPSRSISRAHSRRTWFATAVLPGVLLAAVSTGPRPARAEDSLDVTTYGVVWRVAQMEQVNVECGISFGDGERTLDLYRPPVAYPAPGTTPPSATRSLPVVVFANVTGAPFQDWAIYRDWARLVAAHGIVGVVYQSDPADAAKSLDLVFRHLRDHAQRLGIEPSRMALWACSANVSLALPWLHADPRPDVAAAVLYYGSVAVPELRTDLPIFYVLAGRDSPPLKAGIRTLFAQAATAGAPWTMVSAPQLVHAFDALDRGAESQRTVKQTVAWLVDHLVAPPPPGPQPSLARQALTHTYGQEWDEAIAALRRLAATQPDDVGTLVALGATLARGGQPAVAIPELRRAIALGEDSARVHQLLGQALLQADAIDEGLDALERAVDRGANAAIAYGQSGLGAMGRGSFADAIRIWEAGLTKLPDAAPARRTLVFNLACAHARAGEVDRALARLEQAVDLGFGPRAAISDDEDLVSLRQDPRFAALLARVAQPN